MKWYSKAATLPQEIAVFLIMIYAIRAWRLCSQVYQ
jgi:hypothetical protein